MHWQSLRDSAALSLPHVEIISHTVQPTAVSELCHRAEKAVDTAVWRSYISTTEKTQAEITRYTSDRTKLSILLARSKNFTGSKNTNTSVSPQLWDPPYRQQNFSKHTGLFLHTSHIMPDFYPTRPVQAAPTTRLRTPQIPRTESITSVSSHILASFRRQQKKLSARRALSLTTLQQPLILCSSIYSRRSCYATTHSRNTIQWPKCVIQSALLDCEPATAKSS